MRNCIEYWFLWKFHDDIRKEHGNRLEIDFQLQQPRFLWLEQSWASATDIKN